MPRFSSVQAYSDTQSGARAVSYEQATGGSSKQGAVRTEKVINPSSSTAGAGSGEFHVYRHARAREMERMQQIEFADQEQQKDLEFAQKVKRNQQEGEERTAKRRKKRQRQKEAKLRKKNLAKAGVNVEAIATAATTQGTEEEFTYEPLKDQELTGTTQKNGERKEEGASDFPLTNDGSFLETMKKKLAEEAHQETSDANDDKTEEIEPPTKKQAT